MEYELEDDLMSLVLDECQPTVKVGPFVIEKIPSILKKYIDVFAWCPTDMTFIFPLMLMHKLNIPPNVKLVQQKKTRFATNRSLVIKVEVEQLLKGDILFEVEYPTWLVNPLMVKKSREG